MDNKLKQEYNIKVNTPKQIYSFVVNSNQTQAYYHVQYQTVNSK